MSTAEIVFTGIVYLLGPTKTDANLKVIIPAVTEPSAPFGEVIPHHYAYVKVKKSDVATFTTPLRSPDFVYRASMLPEDTTTNPEFVVFGLKGDTLSLNGADQAPLTPCHKASDCPGKDLYDQIPHRKAVCPDCSGLDQVFLTSNDPRLVSARMIIDRGTLSATHIDPGSEWSFEPMRVKVNLANYPHFFIDDQAVVALTTSSKISLVITPFSGTFAGQPVATLVLKDGARVEIGNLMPDDVLPNMIHHGHDSVDPHFGLYYTMLTRPFNTTDHGSASDPRVPHRRIFFDEHIGGPQQNCVPFADEPDYP